MMRCVVHCCSGCVSCGADGRIRMRQSWTGYAMRKESVIEKSLEADKEN